MEQGTAIEQGYTAVEWMPDERISAIWTVLAIVLGIAGLLAFGFVRAVSWGDFTFSANLAELAIGILIALALITAVAVIHEAIHGLFVWLFGARPSFGFGLVSQSLPVLYCTAEGHRFAPWQYVIIALAPFIVLTAVGAVLVATLPVGGWLVVPLAFNASGAVGDLWIAGLTLAQPTGTLVEDRKAGVIFYQPAPSRQEPPR